MFDLNLIEGVYNKFGNEIERIYNNRNEIIWDLDDGSNDYFWVYEVDNPKAMGAMGYICFKHANDGIELEQDAIMYSWDRKNWNYFTKYFGEIKAYGVVLNRLSKIYFKYTKSNFDDIRIVGGYLNMNSRLKLKCKIGGSLHKFVNDNYFLEGYNMFGAGELDDVNKVFFSGLDITDAQKLRLDYYEGNIPEYGYRGMFYNQYNLVYAPKTIGGYNTYINHYGCAQMFSYCQNLKFAPILNAGTLYDRSYEEMFFGCGQLNVIQCYAHNFNILAGEEENFDPFYVWGLGDSEYTRNGTFYKYKNVVLPGDPIPYGWDIHEIDMPN